MKNKLSLFLLLLVSSFQISVFSQKTKENHSVIPDSENTITGMLSLMNGNEQNNKRVLKHFDNNWNDGYIPMLIDAAYFSRDYRNRTAIIRLIEKKTNKRLSSDLFEWLEWIWNKEEQILPYHGDWMAKIYRMIDQKFERYFKNRTDSSLIRLDEVRWGGVLQDGIPPLRQPKMLSVNQANYLSDSDVVFGISINGDHRAYPKRILAWHEMFVDKVGGENIAGVYCTLCGTVIAYNTKFEGKNYNLGTSGFLYRSNKLMYDRDTQSLWNTIEGKPVIGPLINKDIELDSYAVVTTTWGEWKERHPSTTVLSLDTGHRRNYDEGVAYQEYFSTDQLMFNVPELDSRLKNKDEVLIVRANGYKEAPLAISAKFLNKNKVYQDKIGNTKFVVITDKSGGNRVYEAKDYTFDKVKSGIVKDSNGLTWKIEEEKLVATNGAILNRLPYHRIFWFAWYNTYKNTRLIR